MECLLHNSVLARFLRRGIVPFYRESGVTGFPIETPTILLTCEMVSAAALANASPFGQTFLSTALLANVS